MGKLEEDTKNVKYKLGTGPPVGPNCPICGRPFHIGGPFWLAPIHDAEFLRDLIDSLREEKFGTYERMKGMLTVASEELHDVPFYYTQDRLCSLTRTHCGKLLTFRSALLNAGFRVSLSHANKHALKTDAPVPFIWEMMRAWERENPANRANLAEDSVAKAILDGGDKMENEEAGSNRTTFPKVDFSIHPEANPESRALQLKRFQQNPERNWGPKTRASQGTFGDDAKRIKNQGKKRKKLQQHEQGQGGEGDKKACGQSDSEAKDAKRLVKESDGVKTSDTT